MTGFEEWNDSSKPNAKTFILSWFIQWRQQQKVFHDIYFKMICMTSTQQPASRVKYSVSMLFIIIEMSEFLSRLLVSRCGRKPFRPFEQLCCQASPSQRFEQLWRNSDLFAKHFHKNITFHIIFGLWLLLLFACTTLRRRRRFPLS